MRNKWIKVKFIINQKGILYYIKEKKFFFIKCVKTRKKTDNKQFYGENIDSIE